eukprot:2032596-Rhodomonas_salina.2
MALGNDKPEGGMPAPASCDPLRPEAVNPSFSPPPSTAYLPRPCSPLSRRPTYAQPSTELAHVAHACLKGMVWSEAVLGASLPPSRPKGCPGPPSSGCCLDF